jgi:transposase
LGIIEGLLQQQLSKKYFPLDRYAGSAVTMWMDEYVESTFTSDIPIEKVIQKYFERDVIEKSFYFLKSIVSIQPVRHWLYRRVRAHIFICYLAYLHLSWMKMLLMTHGISMSPVKALQELETIYNVNLTDKKTGMSTTRTVPLTEKQKKIYRALNLLS